MTRTARKECGGRADGRRIDQDVETEKYPLDVMMNIGNS